VTLGENLSGRRLEVTVSRSLFVVPVAALLACAVVAAASCRSASDTLAITPSPESAPDVAWKDKTREQREAHMRSAVHPFMSAMFAGFDRERFAVVECRTCHGSGAADGTYRMPNPDLPRLPGASDGFERLMAEKEQITTFMANAVVPAMASMLGEKPYGPDAPDGFGCFRCHETER
jgi:hypothetical protein